MQDRLLADHGTYGVYVSAGSVQLSELTVRNNTNYGIYVSNASLTLQRSRIYDNGSRGIYLSNSSGTNSAQLSRCSASLLRRASRRARSCASCRAIAS